MAGPSVESIYTAVTGFLDELAETQFGAVAGDLGTTAILLATIAAAAVIINMLLQVKPTFTEDSLRLLIKIILVGGFFANWAQFDAVASAVFDLLQSVAGAMIGSVTTVAGGTVDTATTYDGMAAEFDLLLTDLQAFGDAIADEVGVLGGSWFYSGIFLILNGILGAAAVVLMCTARLVVSLLFALAPLMILCTLFEFTKSYFERWVSACVTFLLFPLVIAGIFSTVAGVLTKIVREADDASSVATLSDALGIVMVIILSIALCAATPVIVMAISGSVHLRAPSAADSIRSLTRTVRQTNTTARTTASTAAQAGQASGNVAKNTVNWSKDMHSAAGNAINRQIRNWEDYKSRVRNRKNS